MSIWKAVSEVGEIESWVCVRETRAEATVQVAGGGRGPAGRAAPVALGGHPRQRPRPVLRGRPDAAAASIWLLRWFPSCVYFRFRIFRFCVMFLLLILSGSCALFRPFPLPA